MQKTKNELKLQGVSNGSVFPAQSKTLKASGLRDAKQDVNKLAVKKGGSTEGKLKEKMEGKGKEHANYFAERNEQPRQTERRRETLGWDD